MKDQQERIERIYGVHPVLEALEAGRSIEKIYVRQGKEHARIQDIRRIARDKLIPLQSIPDMKLDRMARGGNHQGVVAQIAPVAYVGLEETLIALQEVTETPLLLLLDGVTDVRNFGAIARTAEGMGVHAMILPIHGSAALNMDAVRTSAGALHHIPLCRIDHPADAVMMLDAYGIRTVGITEKTEDELFSVDLTGPICLVMGAEDKGISKQVMKRASALGRIPMKGKITSYNVSVAAGMALMEAHRQRA